MKKLIFSLCFIGVSGILGFAQNKSDYNKWEVYGGYSNGQVDTGFDSGNSLRDFFDDRSSFNGFEASGVYNIHRYFGIKADVSGTYNSRPTSFTVPNGNGTSSSISFDHNRSLYNILGGVQVKDNSSDARLKPFAHAMIGVGHGRSKFSNVACSGGIDCTGLFTSDSQTGFAGAFGGGLDIKLSKKIDFRAIQVDYNPIKFDSGTDHNVRFGIGFVFK
ncbi:MAG: outer membrane beta-barrel protein [Acidobacteriota bacterium]